MEVVLLSGRKLVVSLTKGCVNLCLYMQELETVMDSSIPGDSSSVSTAFLLVSILLAGILLKLI